MVFSQSTIQYKANNPAWYFSLLFLLYRWKLDEAALLVLGRLKDEVLPSKGQQDISFDLKEIFEHIIPRAISQSRKSVYNSSYRVPFLARSSLMVRCTVCWFFTSSFYSAIFEWFSGGIEIFWPFSNCTCFRDEGNRDFLQPASKRYCKAISKRMAWEPILLGTSCCWWSINTTFGSIEFSH